MLLKTWENGLREKNIASKTPIDGAVQQKICLILKKQTLELWIFFFLISIADMKKKM